LIEYGVPEILRYIYGLLVMLGPLGLLTALTARFESHVGANSLRFG